MKNTFENKLLRMNPKMRRIMGDVQYTKPPIVDSRTFHMATDGSVKDRVGGGGVILIDSMVSEIKLEYQLTVRKN